MTYHNQHSFDNAEIYQKEVFESRKLNDSGILERETLKEILQQHRIQLTDSSQNRFICRYDNKVWYCNTRNNGCR